MSDKSWHILRLLVQNLIGLNVLRNSDELPVLKKWREKRHNDLIKLLNKGE
jgi:hypothetical protein